MRRLRARHLLPGQGRCVLSAQARAVVTRCPGARGEPGPRQEAATRSSAEPRGPCTPGGAGLAKFIIIRSQLTSNGGELLLE